jgi:hypothetical protein
VRLEDQLPPGKEMPVAVPKSSLLSYVLMDIIMNDFYGDAEDTPVVFVDFIELKTVKHCESSKAN